MGFDLEQLVSQKLKHTYALHEQYVNPTFVKVLRTIGFDRLFSGGDDFTMVDQDGTTYLDLLAGYGVFALGRNPPEVVGALSQALKMGAQLPPNLVQMDCSPLSGMLAEKLAQRAPEGLDAVYFTNSGTESIETAIKFVRCATRRDKLVYLDHAFHGLSTGSLALNGNEQFKEGFGSLLPGTIKVPLGDSKALEKALRKKDVAGFFFEPIQGKGVSLPRDGYLAEARELCTRYGTLMVADEIQTGLGRTGRFFAFEHEGIAPDLICISKALSGGMIPVGAVLSSRAVHKKVFNRMDRCVVHSSTFGQNNLAMVAGLAFLQALEERKLIERAERVGSLLIEKLDGLRAKHSWIKDVRGRGLMIGIEFGSPRGLKQKASWQLLRLAEKGLFAQMVAMTLLKDHRMFTQVSGHKVEIIKLIPSLTLGEPEVDAIVAAFDATLESCNKLGSIWDLGKHLVSHAMGRSKDREAVPANV